MGEKEKDARDTASQLKAPDNSGVSELKVSRL